MFNLYKAERILQDEQVHSIERLREAQRAFTLKRKSTLLKRTGRNEEMIKSYRNRVATFMVDVSPLRDNRAILDDRQADYPPRSVHTRPDHQGTGYEQYVAEIALGYQQERHEDGEVHCEHLAAA